MRIEVAGLFPHGREVLAEVSTPEELAEEVIRILDLGADVDVKQLAELVEAANG